jgi:hypothetical protein
MTRSFHAVGLGRLRYIKAAGAAGPPQALASTFSSQRFRSLISSGQTACSMA